jgi:hypothetical protein
MKARFAVCAVIFLFCGNVNAGINDGLVAYYPFDGSLNDMSGNSLHGIANSATFSKDRLGNQDSSYFLNGIDNFISIKDINGVLNFDAKTEYYSISLWVNLASLPISSNNDNVISTMIMDRGISGNQNASYTISVDGRYGNVFSATVYEAPPGGGNAGECSATAAEISKWYHVVAVFNTQKVILYINGNSETNNRYKNDFSAITKTTNDDKEISVGRIMPSNSYHLNGNIDDIRIYNRAISASEVQQLYQGSCSDEIAVKPYTFTAGTPAKASEINANFDVLYRRINTPRCTN